jgi:hypothetical protein
MGELSKVFRGYRRPYGKFYMLSELMGDHLKICIRCQKVLTTLKFLMGYWQFLQRTLFLECCQCPLFTFQRILITLWSRWLNVFEKPLETFERGLSHYWKLKRGNHFAVTLKNLKLKKNKSKKK